MRKYKILLIISMGTYLLFAYLIKYNSMLFGYLCAANFLVMFLLVVKITTFPKKTKKEKPPENI